MTEGFQLDEHGPGAYEKYLVPAFFEPCADALIGLARPVPGEYTLDVACGTGVVASALARKVGSAGTVAAVDVNEQMVAFAAQSSNGPASLDWQVADAAALPFIDSGFDLVTCQQGLQFFSDQATGVREMHRVLAPGGRMALALWRPIEHNPAFEVVAETLERHVSTEAGSMMRAPFSGPSIERLQQLLTTASFVDIKGRIAHMAVRFPSPREFLRQEVVSSPLAGPVGAIDAAELAVLAKEVDRVLAPYTDHGGVVLPMQTWLISARREW